MKTGPGLRSVIVFAIALQHSQASGPKLSSVQIERAIEEGSRYKTVDKFMLKGLEGRRVKLASAMALDGISKFATFYNDRAAIAAQAAAANQQMRQLSPAECVSEGLLHVYVEVHARGEIPTSKLNRRYREKRAHLVLKIGGTVVQPISKEMTKQSDQSLGMLLGGVEEGKMTFDYAFDLLPEDLENPVEVILIDGDGNRHIGKADLRGVLTGQ